MNKWKEIVAEEVMDSESANRIIHFNIEAVLAVTGIPRKVLCVGTGSGAELRIFDNYGVEHVQGIDLNNESIQTCIDKGYQVENMDMHEMTFEDNSFDLVYLRDVFEHSWAHVIALEQLARVTNKYIAITLPSEKWQSSRHHFIIPTLKQMLSLIEKNNCHLKAYREYDHLLGLANIEQELYIIEKNES